METTPKAPSQYTCQFTLTVTFLGWLSDLLGGSSDFQLEDEKVTSNNLVRGGCYDSLFLPRMFGETIELIQFDEQTFTWVKKNHQLYRHTVNNITSGLGAKGQFSPKRWACQLLF